MSDFLNLEVRVWHGDEWPENRVSIACTDSKHAVMISPRYATIEQAKCNAERIAKCVNKHEELVEHLRNAIRVICGQDGTKNIEEAQKFLAELEAFE